MTAYVDTNVCVWLSQGDLGRITPAAEEVLNAADQLLISPMVLLELEYLHEIQRILVPSRDIFLKLEYELQMRVCQLDFSVVTNVALSEKYIRDPFDRMIVAQAKANGFSYLVTADREIEEKYPRAIWSKPLPT